MMYLAYQAHSDALAPIRVMAQIAGTLLTEWAWPPLCAGPLRMVVASCEMIARAGLLHRRPAFGIDAVHVNGHVVPVREDAVDVTPFGTLLRFRKAIDVAQPRVLLVAPLSGHFATLLRGTVETFLPEHDVYLTDWHNARDVSLSHGRFGFDEYIDHVIRFLEVLGSGAHVVAVCQPCVQVLAAVALMAATEHPAQPRSMTLMAGPVDARVNPTRVNELATSRSIEWFERTLIASVAPGFAGAGRRVYPGFTQIAAFMGMNAERHVKAHLDLFGHLMRGEREQAHLLTSFYDEYFSVLDLPAEFYLETVRMVFQEHLLARGALEWRGRRVDPAAIRRTSLLTVEGEKDDICGIGQTLAAQALCSSLRPYRKRHHLEPGVGHYGVFSGRRFRAQIYPIVKNVILASE